MSRDSAPPLPSEEATAGVCSPASAHTWHLPSGEVTSNKALPSGEALPAPPPIPNAAPLPSGEVTGTLTLPSGESSPPQLCSANNHASDPATFCKSTNEYSRLAPDEHLFACKYVYDPFAEEGDHDWLLDYERDALFSSAPDSPFFDDGTVAF